MPTETNGKVLLRVRPRGFCAGVVRAVDIVELALEAYGNPVYVHHEIVHNTYVVEQLRRRGAIFVETIEEVPHGAVLVFSAHGVPPTVRDEAKARSSCSSNCGYLSARARSTSSGAEFEALSRGDADR